MANIFDTARYILEKSGTMSTMKLQKLCYYSQAWANGPVCPELFYKTKGKYSANAKDETGGEENLSDNQKDTIDKVLEHYGIHDAQWLSQLTHMEDPWMKAREGVPSGMGCNNVITKESMALYYGGL